MKNFINLETWIGFRYLRSKKRAGFISFIGTISIIGIALGVATLIIVLSIMNGFQKEVRSKLFQIVPHMQAGYYNSENNENYSKLEKIFLANNNVITSAPYVNGQILLSNSGEITGTEIIGIDTQTYKNIVDNQDIKNSSSINKLISGKFNIVLGQGIANTLNLNIGDKVTVITPEGNITPAGFIPRIKQFNLVGIIKSNIYELNNSLALINIHDAQKIFKLGNSVSGIRLKLKKPLNAPNLTKSILTKQQLSQIWVTDWTYKNRSYFEAVALEKKMMFIIMALIITVASFNLISSLIMTVNEKRTDIAILRTLGVAPNDIMKIFMVQGSVAGISGIVVGLVIGVLVASNISSIFNFFENLFGFKFIKSEIYFLDYIPSSIEYIDILVIVSISVILVLLATIYPSLKAANTKPAEALRYE